MDLKLFIAKLSGRLRQTGEALQSPLLLAVRLYWGWQFMQSGWGKLHNLSGVTEFFTNLGIPAPHINAIFIANLEFLGGLLLLLGLASRAIGLLLTCNMLVAYLTADRAALMSVFSDPAKFYNADPYTFLFASLLVFVFGAGYFSLDHLIKTRLEKGVRRDEDAFPGKTAESPAR